MDFKGYNILATLVPGFLVLIAALIFLDIPYNKEAVVAYSAIAFFIGFLINALSSWLEDIYNFTWGGKPSEKLIQGKSIWKVPFYESLGARNKLVIEANVSSPTNAHLFAIAMRHANGKKDTRIEDFNSSYAFARSLLTTMLVIIIFFAPKEYSNWKFYALSIPILIIIWLRAKQRSYFYAREVLNEYLKG